MHIVIGAPQRIGSPGKRYPVRQGSIEARVLSVRSPRKRPDRRRVKRDDAQSGDRRNHTTAQDPNSGRVMLLMIPEGYQVPPDIDSGNYRVFLRFTPRR